MKSKPYSAKPKKRRKFNGVVLDVSTGASFLGGTEKQLRAMVSRRVIPFRRLNGRIVFLRDELIAWLGALPGCDPAEARHNSESRK
jgi:hypothetical protein